MLTPEQIEALRDAAGQVADPINAYLISDIARRISEAGQLTSTAAYQVWRAQQLGMSQREIKKQLQKLLGKSTSEINRLLTQSAEVGYNFDIKRLPTAAAIPFARNAAVQQAVSAAVKLAVSDFVNLTQTTAIGFTDPLGKTIPLLDAYRSCMDFAFKQVFTGAADYTTAVRQACKNIASKGVQWIDYESGVHTSLEAAVRRNIMGGLGLMQEQITRQNHDDMGCDGWEISAHANSAPDHEPIQGRQYSDADYTALNNSLLRRIGTLNCGHAAFPIVMGVSSPQYTPEELRKFREDNAAGIDYQGKHYTGYEATQMQRRVETSMRTQKRRILADETVGDKEKLQTDQIKLVRLNDEYARFSRAAGLRTQRERAQVAGFGREQAAGATVEYEKHLQNPQEIVTLKAVTGARITNIYGKPARDHAERYYDLVRNMKTDVSHIAKCTGYSDADIKKIKDFLFNEKHDLGDGRIDRFDPDFAIAQSWQRLVDGKPLPHDLTLINHEAMERELMRGGMSQSEAHIKTSSRYNYSEEVREYYASLKEHKNKQ